MGQLSVKQEVYSRFQLHLRSRTHLLLQGQERVPKALELAMRAV